MARSDLILQLVQSGGSGDLGLFKKVVEAIIADEKSKQHNIYAEKLEELLNLIRFPAKTNAPLITTSRENVTNLIFETKPEILLDDLILNSNAYVEISGLIEEHYRVDLLRSYSMEPRHRILLIGPPGNGKTSLAEAIASSLMLPLVTVRYETIIGSYLGETSTRLKNLFDYVKTQHCVLFFDEFDAIGKERADVHETGEIKRVVSSLLLQIDKLPSYVIVVAATNHSELLDKAVWRRFQVKTILSKPTLIQISQYLNKYQNKCAINFGISSTEMSKKLNGLSFSELKDFCDNLVRKYILSLPNSSRTIKAITSQALANISKIG